MAANLPLSIRVVEANLLQDRPWEFDESARLSIQGCLWTVVDAAHAEARALGSIEPSEPDALQSAQARIAELERENADLKQSVIAFCAPHAVRYAQDFGLPKDHLHPAHYDLLARCGARMNSFTRAALTKGEADA
jgi:hypothetical protein